MSIRRARERRELAITPQGLSWAGPTDPEPDAPLVACELPVALEPRAIAELVARTPIPSTLLHELAARCPPGDDDGDDPRWRRARAHAAIARGDAIGDVRDETGTFIARGVEAVRGLPDGTLVRLRVGELVIGDAPPIALPVVERASYWLPAPLAPDAIDPSQIVVAIRSYQPDHLILLVFDPRGRELARIETTTPMCRPEQVSHGAAGYWMHDDGRHQRVGEPAAIGKRPYMREGVPLSRRWLLAIERELVWVSLDTAERRVFPWSHELRATVRVADTLWATTQEGVWRLRGGEAPVRIWSGDAYGVAVDAAHAWISLSGQSTVIAIEHETGREVWRTKLPHDAYALQRFDAGIVAIQIWRFTWLANDGRILATTDERRDVGVARLADGTVAASCGEQVVIVDPLGTVRRALPMPYDGQIVGATADRFLFGPVSGGEDRISPTALVAFDRTGRITARLVPARRPVLVDEARVYVIENHGELRAWDPRGTALGIVPPPPRLPTERGVTHVGAEVTNPRDDRPQVGIEVHADFLALDGTYGGSAGYLGEVALRVGDGAIATFVRCDLTSGRGGSIAERGSTVFLIDCKLPHGEWSIGSACHLVVLGGELAGRLYIDAAPTASVSVEGVIARRAGNLWLLTSAPTGIPIELGGVTYAWEEDSRSKFTFITAADGTSIAFEPRYVGVQLEGWWRGPERVTPDVIERVLRIVAGRGVLPPHTLTRDEVVDAFDGGVTVQDALAAARPALDGLSRPQGADTRAAFVRCMLAAGCRDTVTNGAARDAIADWVASHADALLAARPGLQLLVDEIRTESRLDKRSAIAFLIEMCARVNVDLGLDTSREDTSLAHYQLKGPMPWGIPATHWWWGKADPEAARSADEAAEEDHDFVKKFG
ncbi:MAG TPA: hypothetical protein VFQ53_36620 [Kofleriaceae bacterium]|nr:hypothetical protein [Kofleriaceae bacterium]